ncbi:hypothetical protein SDC9_184071 [bioreactor metagenome]|uniref:Uncharacterized protein n=1 Tax=bioreactor metagenome TaxID=1076179 RepID=A0A645HDX1_9ZZZZ
MMGQENEPLNAIPESAEPDEAIVVERSCICILLLLC